MDPDTLENPKKLWSFIKSKKNDSTGVSPLKAKNGITYSGSTMKVNTLNEQFVSVFNKDEDASSIPIMGPSPHPSMDHIIVTEECVLKLLSTLQVHKAMGPEELPTRLLKELSDELTPVFTVFYQASPDQGTIPDDWKTANVDPIFKKGDKNKPENYRPVSLSLMGLHLCLGMSEISSRVLGKFHQLAL